MGFNSAQTNIACQKHSIQSSIPEVNLLGNHGSSGLSLDQFVTEEVASYDKRDKDFNSN